MDNKKYYFVEITNMIGEENYNGRCGFVTHIDSLGQLHGTWGGLALIPKKDKFTVFSDFSEIVNRMSLRLCKERGIPLSRIDEVTKSILSEISNILKEYDR